MTVTSSEAVPSSSIAPETPPASSPAVLLDAVGAGTSQAAALPASGAKKPATARKRTPAARTELAAAVTEVVLKPTPTPKPKPAAPAATKARKVVAVPVEEAPKAPAKAAKLKLVRDSFTIPRAEYAAIDALKARALKLERAVKKSELLRAGLMLLAGLDDAALRRAIDAVPPVKTGRPKKAKERDLGASQASGKSKSAKD